MANFGIKIDLMKINGAFQMNIKGSTQTKRCVCIPVEDNPNIFLGEKGLYMSMTAIEMKEAKYSDTHVVKADLPKEVREKMTDEQRKAVPILGGMHEIVRGNDTPVPTYDANSDLPEDGSEDLPF